MLFKIFFIIFLIPQFLLPALLKDVTLRYKPTSTFADYPDLNLSGLSNIKIKLGDFIDERENVKLIGENREDEDEGKILPVTTKSSVPDFLKETFGILFKDLGIGISESSNIIFNLNIKKFMVIETNLYRAEVSFNVSLLKNGNLVYDENVRGSAKRFGRSYKLDNYLESLSDAILDAFASLFKNERFLKALKE